MTMLLTKKMIMTVSEPPSSLSKQAPPASSRDSNCQQYPPPSGSSSPLDSWLEAPGIEFIGCKWHIIRNGIVYTTWTKTSHQEACLEKKKKDSSQHPDSLRTPSYSYQPPPRVAPSSQPHEELGYPQVSENQASDGDSNKRSQEENEEDYSTESPPYITTAEELANPRFGIDSSSEYDSRSPSLPTDSEKNFGVSEQPVRHHHRTSMPSSATIGPRRDPNPMKPRAQKRKDPSDLFGNIMNNWNSQPKSSVVHEPKKFPAVKKTRK
uniref:WW domain-containing protein n=1 Tax=Caenorhabditis tropicalis TaxID=1561998 RepID=A0A1I7TFT5_9PELO